MVCDLKTPTSVCVCIYRNPHACMLRNSLEFSKHLCIKCYILFHCLQMPETTMLMLELEIMYAPYTDNINNLHAHTCAGLLKHIPQAAKSPTSDL